MSETHPHKNKVHKILAHSYLSYFIFFLAGVFLDLIFPAQGWSAFGGSIFHGIWPVYFGALILILATMLIVWAQRTTRNLSKEALSRETFSRGPYKYTRSPTHWGLFLLMLGFGFMANAPFVVLFSIVSLLVSKVWFLNKQEEILADKYGAHYVEYKKFVKF